MMMAFKICIFE